MKYLVILLFLVSCSRTDIPCEGVYVESDSVYYFERTVSEFKIEPDE